MNTVGLTMKKLLSALFVVLFALTASQVVAEQNDQFAVTGTVQSVDRAANKIVVGSKTYNLMSNTIIRERNRRGEIEPRVKTGDRVGLVFFTSSTSSSVKEVWILGGSR